MKRIIYIISILFITSFNVFSQNDWQYVNQLYFPPADSDIVRPYLCSLAEDGTLWVLSTRIQDPSAHNSVYFLPPGDTLFQKFIDYNNNGDSDSLLGNIGALRGLTTLGNTLYISATQPYPKTQPNTVSAMYLYPNFDTLQVIKFGYQLQGSGYGSYNHGIDISSDSIIFAGISFGSTFRCYNFSYGWNGAAYGSYIPPPAYTIEPGGPQTGGIDLIRDVALLPGGDYDDSLTVFYTSRNSYSNTQLTGGIAVWLNGTQKNPVNYEGFRVTDFDGFLTFINPYPYGITVDNDGYLWVAGVDTTRRWVKAFEVQGINAIEIYDLPSKFSEDFPDPNGAPMPSPSDVVISEDGKTAYVVDQWGRSAFKFVKGPVGVEDENLMDYDFELFQNYPNPFNPSTLIRFTLAENSQVKLVVTDILGNEVATLVNEFLPEGKYTRSFDGKNLTSGVYFYTLTSGQQQLSRKMLLIK
jgi:hypothetical protein